MHCLKVLVQKQVIRLPIMFRMSDLYFASCSLGQLSGLHFPNIKMSIYILHIKIFED